MGSHFRPLVHESPAINFHRLLLSSASGLQQQPWRRTSSARWRTASGSPSGCATAEVTLVARWWLHCLTRSRDCDYRLVVPMGKEVTRFEPSPSPLLFRRRLEFVVPDFVAVRRWNDYTIKFAVIL
uniref:Uncharacterized protein n=1 Tax=Triticum aestivum TaxID=4565 RepID=A0A080YTX4_WHEAT|nr:unnamed protein product [Triticum aestivum]